MLQVKFSIPRKTKIRIVCIFPQMDFVYPLYKDHKKYGWWALNACSGHAWPNKHVLQWSSLKDFTVFSTWIPKLPQTDDLRVWLQFEVGVLLHGQPLVASVFLPLSAWTVNEKYTLVLDSVPTYNVDSLGKDIYVPLSMYMYVKIY